MKKIQLLAVLTLILLSFTAKVFASETPNSNDLLDVSIYDTPSITPSNYSFNSSVYIYDGLTIPNSSSSIIIVPLSSEVADVSTAITMSVDGGASVELNSRYPSSPIYLIEGVEKKIDITTTDTDSLTDTVSLPKTYTFKVTRELSSNKTITAFNLNTAGVIDEINHTITASVPFGTDVTALTPIITINGNSVSPASGDAIDFTNPVTYTVTALDSSIQEYIVTVIFDADPDISLLTADMNALTDDSIKGTNTVIGSIAEALTSPLPSLGLNGSLITWESDKTEFVSNDGQSVVRPAYSASDVVVRLTATFSKGIQIDTKVFILTVLRQLPSSNTNIVSSLYSVNRTEESNTILNVPFGTSKNVFLVSLSKEEPNQTWINEQINDPVVSGDSLVVTAEDGISQATYNISVNDRIINRSGGAMIYGGNTGRNISTQNTSTPAVGKVLGASTYNFTSTLRTGSRGDEVRELQKFLNNAGYDCGEVDGIFGPKTRAAVLKFQIANGILNGYGTVGPLTRAILNK